MFIFDDSFNTSINADKIKEIRQRKWKDGTEWKSESIAYFGSKETPIKIAENEVILSFYPATAHGCVISCWWDDEKKTSFIESVPIIGWVQVLDNGIQPFTAELSIPTISPFHKWGIRMWEREDVIVPCEGTFKTVELFQQDCEKRFRKE